ncbi:HD domain-containing phosphohydrolase [Desulfonatronovibrio hydrogenovorans]|uniref:HD domain-containing phosphohydrolase n=1 Tax=Desulfonatronovibrio hydrogenovorans TaxID=53245 RepID=UPI0004908FCD|nr:HD domain-containing phosphohydrolase [Desulfonatronovibrio hydrogenovorans]
MEVKNDAVKILVVDDEESLREICKDALVDEGYQVLQAEDGREALSILAANDDIDLIVSDLRMPVMNGLELLEKIKEVNLDIDFLVMTGFATIETAVECMKMGAADYLPKPFNINHLLVKVSKVVKARRAKQERKRLSNIVRMLNLSNALNAQLDLKSICYEFVLQVQRNFSPESAVLFIQKDQGNSLGKAVVRGRLFREDPDFFARVQKLAQDSLENGSSYLLDKTRAQELAMFSGQEFPYSMLVVPLFSRMKKVGVIVLIRRDTQLFTNDDLQLLSVFAAHVATAIQNAKMYTRMRDQNIDIIRSYAKAVEAKDYYTKGHSERVAVYAIKLGSYLKLDTKELEALYTSGVLHDIGKIGIPDHILNKPSRLDEEEFEVMKSHPSIARDILSQVWSLKHTLPVVYHHHERIDGKGYPDGIMNGQIPFLAKVISVVDAFEAMTSDRAYRRALDWEKARDILLQGSGTQWESDLVDRWVKLVSEIGFDNIQNDTQDNTLHFHRSH